MSTVCRAGSSFRFCGLHHRVLSQLSSEVHERQVVMEKQKKETVFLRQKSEQYQKQVSAIKVSNTYNIYTGS